MNVLRYVTPLREGGSLPAIVEADDDGLYVLKFRRAGQGPKALIAELVAGEIARALGLLVPDIVFAELDADLARTEPDPEIQDLIRGSAGLNLAIDYLPGSVAFDPIAELIPSETASAIVWLDGCVTNVDRTPRNANMLMCHGRLWLIDHGAALYVHHATDDFRERSRDPFPLIKDHILLPRANSLAAVDPTMAARLTRDVIDRIVTMIPDGWLDEALSRDRIRARRDTYRDYLLERLQPPRPFVEEAMRVRALHV